MMLELPSFLLGFYLGGVVVNLTLMSVTNSQPLVPRWAHVLALISLAMFWPLTLLMVSRQLKKSGSKRF